MKAIPESWRSSEVRGRAARWVPGATVGLVFLVFPGIQAVTGDYPVPAKILGVAALVLTGGLYQWATPWAMGWAQSAKIWLIGAMLVISLGLWPVAGSNLVVVWIFSGVMAGALLTMRQTAVVAVVLAVGMLLASRTDGQAANWELAGALVGLSFWMCAFMGNIRLARELEDTRQELAVAAVAAERERIGRDLHDILGHSLTAIAVKAGLARRLIEQGATGALDEIADVERLAREALADVRATASGYRQVSLASELAVAATVLRAAGVAAQLPVAVDSVDPTAREVLGYVVREAVTNIVRHAGATSCTITVGTDWLEVIDDGHGAAVAPTGSGAGLPGLHQRLQQVGGVLDAGPLPGGFRVRAHVPAGAPQAASSPQVRLDPATPAAAATSEAAARPDTAPGPEPAVPSVSGGTGA